jgi:hypothetical protein
LYPISFKKSHEVIEITGKSEDRCFQQMRLLALVLLPGGQQERITS